MMDWKFVVYGAVVAAVLGLMGLLGKFLAEKAKGNKLFSVAFQLEELVKSVVAHAEAEIRPEIQKALDDGSLNADEAKLLKAKAMELLKAALGDTVKGLPKVLGIEESAIGMFLSGLIEQAVVKQKAVVP